MSVLNAAARLAVLLGLLGLAAPAAQPQEQEISPEKAEEAAPAREKEPWRGELKDGTEIDEKELRKILELHREWFLDNRRVIFRQKKDLPAGVWNDPRRANLSGAILWCAALRGASLVAANLSGAKLHRANLKDAGLSIANLRGAKLVRADLRGADFFQANLSGVDLRRANLSGANLVEASLKDASFQQARLDGVRFEAIDWGATKQESNKNANEKDLVNVGLWATARGLEFMHYLRDEASLVELRAAFRQAQMVEQAHAVSFSISRGRQKATLHGCFVGGRCNLFSLVRAFAAIVLFQWTVEYGAEPWRALWILLGSVFLFGFIYFFLPRAFERPWEKLGDFNRVEQKLDDQARGDGLKDTFLEGV